LQETGGERIDRRPVNIMDIIDEVLGMTQMAVDKSGRPLVGSNVVIVNNVCEGKLPMVLGDSYKITQLLYNLVTNAAKFTIAGSIQLSAREDREEGMLEIDVADTGKGISPEALKNIFEPFQQQENKDARSFQGIGLGLSVANTIAQQHDGSIRVTSKCGQGTTFTVVLPCDFNRRVGPTVRVEESAVIAKGQADNKPRVPRGGALPPMGQRPLALSVDDDDINQEVIEQTLGSEFRIVRAMNGMEALEYLDSGKEFPSLMLLDVMMPGMTGFEVVHEIRNKRNISHTELPVVMLSAKSPQEATANEAFVSGATDYMQKPFSAIILRHHLHVINEVRQELRSAEIRAREASDQNGEQAEAKNPEKSASVGLPLQKKELRESSADDPAAVAARAEAILKLEQERDQFKEQLDAKNTETTKANLELQQVTNDRDRLKAELNAAVKAAATAAATAMTVTPYDKADAESTISSMHHNPRGMASVARALDLAQTQASFYKAEVELRDRQIIELRGKVANNKCDAYLQRQRADAIDRELRFVRQLGHCLSTDA